MEGKEKIIELVKGLHALERKVLPLIEEFPSMSLLMSNAGLLDVEVMRSVQWLGNKGLVTIKEEELEIITLDENGKKYAKEGLPEKKFLHALSGKSLTIEEIGAHAVLTPEEVQVSLGALKSRLLIALDVIDGKKLIQLTELGEKALLKESLEEQFLKRVFPVHRDELNDEERFAFDVLMKRKRMVKLEKRKERYLALTDLGKLVALEKELLLESQGVERLTRAMLVDGSWKGKKFRPYDVQSNVPKISYGRKHFDNEALSYIKKIWLEMGFTEMQGGLVQTAFWDLDALFVPQDHPAREMQDTFYLKKPSEGRIPEKLAAKVKEVHESGKGTGSRGWRIPFDYTKSKQLLLRTHTTVLSAQTLSRLKKSDLPAKFFCVGKVFRNEATDWKHDMELYQVEGIVVDPNANLSHLKGYLKEFYKKMGFSDVRMRPAYFPYTEPSLEVEVWHPTRKTWVELGGAGIFRPEVTIPLLGEDVPVLAWGNGMGRIISAYYELKSIREIYQNDLKQLKTMKAWFMTE